MEIFKKILNEPFISDIQINDGKIYFVGGLVRDYFLNKASKDIDIVVCNIDINRLTEILEKHGKVDLVGKSFGVLKFYCNSLQETIDIALPRTDKKKDTETGHKAFEIVYDHKLDIKEDLFRRDITINSICLDNNLNIIDPYNGLIDLYSGIIRPVSTKSFVEDPLRILRALQFAARFDFYLSPETERLISLYSHELVSISKERIIEEINKVVYKQGDLQSFAYLIRQFKIDSILFNFELNVIPELEYVTTLSEFLFLVSFTKISNVPAFFKEHLLIDNKTEKELTALCCLFDESISVNERIYNSLKHSKIVLYTKLHFGSEITKAIENFNLNRFPHNVTDLTLSGADLMELGLKGSEIGIMQKQMIKNILSNTLTNSKTELTRFIKENS